MYDLAVAPTFSAFFIDGNILPRTPISLLENPSNPVNAQAVIIMHTSMDGTAGFYGIAPTLPGFPNIKHEYTMNTQLRFLPTT